jgi:hypothetical protein
MEFRRSNMYAVSHAVSFSITDIFQILMNRDFLSHEESATHPTTILLTTQNIVLLEKLTDAYLLKDFPTRCENTHCAAQMNSSLALILRDRNSFLKTVITLCCYYTNQHFRLFRSSSCSQFLFIQNILRKE